MRAPLHVVTRFVCVATCALTCAQTAHAAGFASARFGGEHGNVLSINPTALYFNPGAMAFVDAQLTAYADLSIALRRATYEHERSLAATDLPEPPGAIGANYGKAELFNVFAGPMAGGILKLGDFALGAGFFVPFGGRASWSENEAFASNRSYPQAAAGVARWFLIEGQITFIHLGLGAAYKLGPLAIGATSNLILGSVGNVLDKTPLNDNGVDPANVLRTTVDVSGVLGSFGLGAMLEALPEQLWFGVSYQAQPGLGEFALDGTLVRKTTTGSTKDKVSLHQALPDVIRAGARYRVSRAFELRLFGDITRWSVLQTQCLGLQDKPCVVDRDGEALPNSGTVTNLRRWLNDTYGVRLGASYFSAQDLELFGGLGLESAAMPDATLDPSMMDGNSVATSFGGRFAVGDSWQLAVSYTHIQAFDRDNTGWSELSLPTGGVTKRLDAGGYYTQWIGVLNTNLTKTF
jgi:long-chain fatty acid transport protein